MKDVKMPTSDSYLDALIESLKNPEKAAGYLSAALEAEDFEPEIIRAAMLCGAKRSLLGTAR